MPTARTTAGSSGSIRRTSLSRVSPLAGMARRSARRAPARPPRASPRWRWTSPRRPVRRDQGPAAMAGRRSVKIRRGHSVTVQRKRRASIRISTVRPCQGRSARVRKYRLWTRYEAWPQTGQQAPGAFGAVVIMTVSADGKTCRISRPGGIWGRLCLDKPVTGSTGCSWYVRIQRRFAHQRHQVCG